MKGTGAGTASNQDLSPLKIWPKRRTAIMKNPLWETEPTGGDTRVGGQRSHCWPLIDRHGTRRHPWNFHLWVMKSLWKRHSYMRAASSLPSVAVLKPTGLVTTPDCSPAAALLRAAHWHRPCPHLDSWLLGLCQ